MVYLLNIVDKKLFNIYIIMFISYMYEFYFSAVLLDIINDEVELSVQEIRK